MNITEAVKSGKAFRRKNVEIKQWFNEISNMFSYCDNCKNDTGRLEKIVIFPLPLTGGKPITLGKEDILAEDWEIKDPLS